METFVTIITLVLLFTILGELESIKKRLNNKEKTKWNLKELVGKTIKVSLDDEIDISLEGMLVSFDQNWIEIKVIKKHNHNEIYYKRIENIKSIALKNE